MQVVVQAVVLLANHNHVTAELATITAQALETSLEPVVDLEKGWHELPSSTRVRCWWWWINGNVTKQAITRDLEAMKAKGIGGANIIDAAASSNEFGNKKIPPGPKFASPEWCELFHHALSEADRLGLELGLNIQSGWNLGGPTVNPEQAAKKLAWSKLTVEGGKSISVLLREPRSEADFYRDIKVLALPLPIHNIPLSQIKRWRQKAYHDYPGKFSAIDASFLMEAGTTASEAHVISPKEVVDLSANVVQSRLTWDAPPGRWLVLRLGYTISGSHVSTSSDTWKGLAIDYLDSSAFDKYCDDVLTPLLDGAGPLVGQSLRYLHTDSWELGPVNWTSALPDRFLALRGYDMTPYLPALVGYAIGGQEEATRFLNDFRRTLGDLIADGKYRAFSNYAHARGLGIHPESGGPHAAPVDALKCLGRSDIMMGEFWARSPTHRVKDTQRLFVKQPSSAAHVYGRRFVMAESFTTIGPHWEKDPRDLKPVFDRAACEGLNMVMWHTFDCSPPEAGIPGNAYFAGTHFNPQITWWEQADGFLGYLNRCQFLLQQGLPVSDVLYFYGENVPNFVRLKRDNPAGLPKGYDYDVINLEALLARTQVEHGRITLPDGVSYAVLMLPPKGHYGRKALKHIARLAEAGGVVLGEKPYVPFGLPADRDKEQAFGELATRLWEKGLIRDLSASQFLEQSEIDPDFTYTGEGEPHLDFIHRRTSDAEVYFVVNRNPVPADVLCSFRVDNRRPEIWKPVCGTIEPATIFRQMTGRTDLPLRLPPNGSVFVVFRDEIAGDVSGIATRDLDSDGRTIELALPWRVVFDQKVGKSPGEMNFASLIDWTESKDPRIRYFSGTATYWNKFQWPHDGTGEGDIILDLGEVKNLARVHLNGRDLGVAWTPPFRVDLSPALQQGVNKLRIEVVNLWANRLIGDARLPANQRITKTNIQKFKGNESLLPSGLLGPVQIFIESGVPEELTTRATSVRGGKLLRGVGTSARDSGDGIRGRATR